MSLNKKKVVYVVYYSMYGHVLTMAKQIAKGLESAGVEAKLWQIGETLPESVLKKMQAPPKNPDIPIITPNDLANADGILFGIANRFGSIPAQMKTLFDSCGHLWMSIKLKNKYVGTFFCTGSIDGGQETTAYSTIPFFAHMGMLFVSFGSKTKPNSEFHGGSAWGSGTVSGIDGLRQPSEYEFECAHLQGVDFGKIVKGSNF